jgi:hypothetical protein
MRSTNGHAPPETVLATAHSSAARCIARGLVVAFDACDEAEIPLTQLQRATIVEAALLEFDGFGVHVTSLATVSRLLREMRASGPSAAA